ncbi:MULTISPECIES: anti-sigma factor RsbA family regulatory protein [Geodermatophilus]|uniref:Anti-sigma factor RsbA family regulatory protein n=1 Tax=Geodermatophilus arenarius TaxID=1137990 RepID=A0ABV9LNS0_9ACTN
MVRHSHTAALVRSDDETTAVAASFLEEGLRHGDLPVVAASPRTAALVRDALGERAGAVEEDARICLLGVRTPDAMVVTRRLLDRARATGSGRLRVLGEVQFGTTARSRREGERYESAANALLATAPLTALCLYDRRWLPDEVVAGARRTHPELVMGGVRVSSSEFRQPAEFLRELALRRDPVEAGEPVYAVDGAPALAGLRGELRRVFGEVVPDEDQRADLHLGVSEVAANAFRHGRRPISARVWADRDTLVVTITDSGTGFADPLAGFVPAHGDDLAAGGMGLWLARKLWDSVDLVPGPAGLTVRLAAGLADPVSRRGAA